MSHNMKAKAQGVFRDLDIVLGDWQGGPPAGALEQRVKLERARSCVLEIISDLDALPALMGELHRVVCDKTGQAAPMPDVSWDADGTLHITFPSVARMDGQAAKAAAGA